MKLNTAPLKDIEYGMPVLADGTYFAKIDDSKVQIKANKSNTGNNLVVPVTIISKEMFTFDGKPLENRGQIKLTMYVSLVPTTDYNPDGRLKELAVACHVPEDKQDFEVADVRGFVKVKVVYNKPQGQFGDSNSIARFLPIKDSDNFNPDA